MANYDYLIVGSGLFGSIFAYEATKRGKKCLVVEKRDHIGGNCYTEKVDGINIHKYGPHIFHTNNKTIWNYVNQFAEFNNFICQPKAFNNGRLYSLPFNLNTINEIYGYKTPQEAIQLLKSFEISYGVKKKDGNDESLEDFCVKSVGPEIYNLLIKDYTEKQWGVSCSKLPSSIIKRLPIRTKFNNNYFNDRYQGIPIGGYTQIFEKLLENIKVEFNCDYIENKQKLESIANKIVYTGSLDELFNYELGQLDYRSLKFEHERIAVNDFQGNAVINYTSKKQPYTRIVEHKHFEGGDELSYTIITKEYSIKYNSNKLERFYPIENIHNRNLYNQYFNMVDSSKYILGGRLAEYRYYDMHQVIGSALSAIKKYE